MTPRVDILRALSDPLLLGGSFEGPTWEPWKALLGGAFALPLTAAQLATFRQLTDRDPPSAPVRELWVVAGRRGGKSRIAAAVAVWAAALRTHRVAAGEVPTVLMTAADKATARVATRYALGLMRASPLLAPEIVSDTRERIVLRNGAEIEIVSSDYRAVRGRTLVAAVLDECAFWEASPESVNPDTEVYSAVRPGMATQPDAVLIGISSPYAQRGLIWEQFRRYYGQPDPHVLVARAPSLVLNPSLPRAVVEDALARDPDAARAEWLAEFRTDVASFLDAALVDSLTRTEPRELPRMRTTVTGTPLGYVAGLDVSGGRGDAAAAAVAHREGDRVLVDACRRWPAPHDPAVVAREVAAFLGAYGLTSALADRYGAELARSVYREAGVALLDAPDSRSNTYGRLLPLLTTGRVELPPDPTLRHELLGLERRTARGGRDSIDHRPGGHDDLANAVALAAVAAARPHASGRSTLTSAECELALDFLAEFGPPPMS